MVFPIDDKTIKCDNRTDAILEYTRQVSMVSKNWKVEILHIRLQKLMK